MTDVKLPPLPEPDAYAINATLGFDVKENYSPSKIVEYARLAVLQERERCAKLADKKANQAWKDSRSEAWSDEFEILADAIRKGE